MIRVSVFATSSRLVRTTAAAPNLLRGNQVLTGTLTGPSEILTPLFGCGQAARLA
jgi:hypothetical protein